MIFSVVVFYVFNWEIVYFYFDIVYNYFKRKVKTFLEVMRVFGCDYMISCEGFVGSWTCYGRLSVFWVYRMNEVV